MKKKGFTLIELLATIIVLAIIGLIVYPTLNNVIQGNKEKLYNKQIDELVRHANTWAVGNIEKLGDKDSYLLSFDEMYKYGLLQSSMIKNPKTNQDLQGCMVLVKGESGYTASYSEECKAVIPKKNCTFNGELVQGAEFVDGQYTYKYKQEFDFLGSGDWSSIDIDGWGVMLTDKDSTSPVTTKLCSTINDKPIVTMNGMFLGSQAESIDLSSFDTSNVTSMIGMFAGSQATNLDLSSFDTSNVTNMSIMFNGSQASSLDLSSFNTSSVTDKQCMFCVSGIKSVNLSSFDTSNVTNMAQMFMESQIITLDLSNFSTVKVIDMTNMFLESQTTSIDLSSFDTSKVTSMRAMFANSQATSLDLSSFDTSDVTDMSYMFSGAKATTGYAKTQVDADKFNDNSVSDIPSTLTFTVK